MDDVDAKSQPGKDQNHVLDAMRIGRGMFGLRYAYFSNETAVLMDKLTKYYRQTAAELGGEASGDMLESMKTIAMHSTCYEQR
jgi:hypothetical protein